MALRSENDDHPVPTMTIAGLVLIPRDIALLDVLGNNNLDVGSETSSHRLIFLQNTKRHLYQQTLGLLFVLNGGYKTVTTGPGRWGSLCRPRVQNFALSRKAIQISLSQFLEFF